MGRELSREFPRKRGEPIRGNRGYRRSMKRKIEPRVSREKRNFTIDRFERVALSLRSRGLWNPCEVLGFRRDRDRVKAGSD